MLRCHLLQGSGCHPEQHTCGCQCDQCDNAGEAESTLHMWTAECLLLPAQTPMPLIARLLCVDSFGMSQWRRHISLSCKSLLTEAHALLGAVKNSPLLPEM